MDRQVVPEQESAKAKRSPLPQVLIGVLVVGAVVLLILIALFLIIVGPAILNMIHTLNQPGLKYE